MNCRNWRRIWTASASTLCSAFGSDQDFKDATQQIAILDQLELGLPEKGYYERKDEKSVKLRSQYQAHVARTFELLGESQAQAAKDAETVLSWRRRLPDFPLAMWSGAILRVSTTR